MNARNQKWLETTRRIQALARNGLSYGEGLFDLERYEEMDHLSTQLIADLGEESVESLPGLLTRELGYQTPKIGVRGMIFEGETLLMVQEKRDQLWAPPGGWADIGFSPAQITAVEVKEEAGLEVKVDRLLALYDGRLHEHPPRPEHIYKLFFLCQITGGNLQTGLETQAVQYCSIHNLPPLAPDKVTTQQIHQCYEISKDPNRPAFFD